VAEADIKVGTIVHHPKRPAWGPGKTLAVGGGGQVTVYFRDLEETKVGEAVKTISTSVVGLEVADEQNDPMLDSLPPFAKGKFQGVRKPRFSLDHAVQLFVDAHPRAFEDPTFIEQEREPALEAGAMWAEAFGDGRGSALLEAGRIADACAQLVDIDDKLGFLNSQEKAALKVWFDTDEVAGDFLGALIEVDDQNEPEQTSFQRLIDAVDALVEKEPSSRSTTWPLLTHFPHVFHPESHIRLRPAETQKCAARLNFDLRYSTSLNWWTYAILIDMAKILEDRLDSLGARDFIDVQFFIATIAKA